MKGRTEMLLLKAAEHNWGLIGPGNWEKHSWKINDDGWYEVFMKKFLCLILIAIVMLAPTVVKAASANTEDLVGEWWMDHTNKTAEKSQNPEIGFRVEEFGPLVKLKLNEDYTFEMVIVHPGNGTEKSYTGKWKNGLSYINLSLSKGDLIRLDIEFDTSENNVSGLYGKYGEKFNGEVFVLRTRETIEKKLNKDETNTAQNSNDTILSNKTDENTGAPNTNAQESTENIISGRSETHASSGGTRKGNINLGTLNHWLGKPVEDVGEELEEMGYKPSPENKTGVLKDVAWEFISDSAIPYSVVVWFNTEERDASGFTYHYDKNPNLFFQYIQSLNLLFGEPFHQEYEEEHRGSYHSITVESLSWNVYGINYHVLFSAKDDGSRGTLEDAVKGTAGFSIYSYLTDTSDSEEEEATSEITHDPTNTPAPTATPRPVNVEVTIDKVEIKATRYGTKEFYIRLKNNSSNDVDRVDFYVQGYNAYGERIEDFSGAYIFNFYCEELLKPGKTTPKDYYYTHYDLNEAVSLKIAIVKYHKTNGQTVEVPENQYKWETFK